MSGSGTESAAPLLALLVRAVDYQEADRIATFITDRRGKLSARCRGARRSKRRFAGALEPFALLRLEFVPRNKGHHLLTAVTVERAFTRILGDLQRLAYAASGIELISSLTAENDTDGSLFPIAVSLLEDLDGGANPLTTTLAHSLHALSSAGYQPEVDVCGVTGRTAPPTAPAYFDPRSGAIVSRVAGGARYLLSGPARAFVRQAANHGKQATEVALSKADAADVWSAIHAFAEAQTGRALKASAAVAQFVPAPTVADHGVAPESRADS